MNTIPIPTSQEWQPGQRYSLKYDIGGVNIAGLKIPDILVPEDLKQAAIEKSTTSALEKLATDPRFKIESYSVDAHTMTVNVLATGNASPVLLIVLAIAIVFGIYGISLVLNQASKVTGEVDKLVKDAGPALKGSVLALSVAAAGVVGLIAYAKYKGA
jgi:hypothetical protein